MVGEAGIQVSGGQRQRIGIARAILRQASIVVFDEATSALDAQSDELITEAVGRLMANKTVLVIAHRLSTIKHAHAIAVLDKGKIVQLGTYFTLTKEEGAFKEMTMFD